MRLYARTLLFFLGAITFQALLTAGLIIGLVSRNNQTVTRAALHEESALVYENYTSWIRSMWKTTIDIRDNADLTRLSDEAEGRTDERLLAKSVEAALRGSGIDSFVIRRKAWDQFEILTDAYPYVEDFSPFIMDRNHPYIALKSIEGYVFLVASMALGSESRLFLLKHIDDDFYNQLKTRDHARIFISSDSKALWNAVGDGTDYSKTLDLDELYPPYQELYDQNFGKGHYNISLQNIGTLEGDGELKLLVFMSVEPYFSLLLRIGRIVLYVSAITGVITAVVALIFTGRLTTPIHRLVMAMEKIRNGDFKSMVPEKALGEVRTLVSGFNSMVRHLRENQVTLDSNLREITFLKEYNETIIHSLRAGILVVNEKLVVEKSNSFYREYFSRIEGNPEGRPLGETGPGILDNEIVEAARGIATGTRAPWMGVRRDGESVWEVKVYPLGKNAKSQQGRCVIELDDISIKMDLEQKILQAEKLSSLSLLSAGIAHEINNPLSTILSNAQLLLTEEKDEEKKDSLEWIEKETRRIAGIVQELREFSHDDDNTNSSHDMNVCVEEVVRLVRYGISTDSDIHIQLNQHPGKMLVRIPRDELRQAILNILQNAVQALKGKGEIILETFHKDKSHYGIIIEDNGEGIPEEIRNRIFDPFFTTKRSGVGTGLGLSIVYGIMTKFAGDISVRSQVGLGTAITLLLPADGEAE